MTDPRIARYLDELASALRTRGVYSRCLLHEVRDHLLDSGEAARGRGLAGDAACAAAIAAAGTPESIARRAAADATHVRRGMLLSVCVGTMLSIACLSLLLLALRPPRANYRQWWIEAGSVFLLTAVTFAWAKAGDLTWRWTDPVLLLSNLVLASIGAMGLYGIATEHFEGYALILGILFVTQGVLTLVHLRLAPRASLPHV